MKKAILIPLFFCFAQIIFSQTSKTVEINAGGLSSALTEAERATITHLTVTGYMNSNDYYFIRNNMPLATHLYLGDAEITDKTVPSYAFYQKYTLEHVVLPKTATRIENYAFYQCTSLKTVTLPDSLNHLGHQSFYNCIQLETISFPESLTFIDSYAFQYCSSLSEVLVLPPKMTVIKSYTFHQCTSLTGVILPDSLQVIENSAFQDCTSLDGELIIPSKVTSIGSNVFLNTWFKTCKIRAVTPPAINVGSPSFGRLNVFFVPEEGKNDYRTNSNWSRYVIIGGDEMVEISVNLNTPGTLGDLALQQVEYLKDVNVLTISGQMNNVDMDLLKNNFPDLLYLDFSKTNITDIPNSHFTDKANLASVILPDSLQTLGERAFFRCYNLQKVVIPTKVKEIRQYTFYDNYNLTELIMPAGLTTIGNYAFQYCHSLFEIEFPVSLETFGYQSFYNNSRLRKITIKDKVSDLPSDLFAYCEMLSEVNLANTIKSIGNNTFYNCKSLSHIILPANLASIGTNAFYNCSLEMLALPPGLHTIGNSAFNNCTKLRFIRCTQPTPPPLSNEIFNNLDKANCTLEVPFWSESMYKQANVWSYFGTINTFTTEMKEIPINGTLTLNQNVRPPGFPNVTVMSTGSLTVGGNAPFVTDKFEVFSRLNGNAWGSLVNNCPAMSANTVKASFDVNGNKWYFLSFPFDVKVSDIMAHNNGLFVVRYYDGATRALNGASGNWKNMTGDSIMKAGTGYIFNCNINTKVEFPAMDETRNQIFNLDIVNQPLASYPTQTAAHKNWNFVGNPYPSYYDSRYIECTAPITVWNLSNNTYNAYSLVDDKYAVKPFESFFIQKPDDVTQVTFVPAGRLPSATIPDQGPSGAPSKMKAFYQSNRLLINLEIADEINSDKSRVVINENAMLNYETHCDAAKFMSSEPTVPQLYSFDADGITYAINERPLLDGIVKLGFRAGSQGEYRIKSEVVIDDEIHIILHDKMMNREVDFVNQEYHFSSQAGTFNERFELQIAKVVSGNDEQRPDRNFVSTVNGQLLVHTQNGNSITVYSMNGMLVRKTTAETNNTYLTLPKGSYLVKVGDELFKSVVF